jgi:ribonuclease HI
MKKIKLDHESANMVLSGGKTSVWRLYDDKDLTVNDVVELVDKVDPEQPQSWKVIGTGRINRIIEKRLGDIQPEDYDGRDSVGETPRDRLLRYRGYYGEKVSMDTPVKIVHFDFTPASADDESEFVDASEGGRPALIGEHVTLYADGGSRGNPGPSACGFVLLDDQDTVLVDKGVYLGITTNNQAEYQGLKSGLEEAQKMGAREVDVRLDSLLVVNQMRGVFKIKNRDLWPIHQSVKELVAGFRKVTFTHVPRELNRAADAAVNRALDEAENTPPTS